EAVLVDRRLSDLVSRRSARGCAGLAVVTVGIGLADAVLAPRVSRLPTTSLDSGLGISPSDLTSDVAWGVVGAALVCTLAVGAVVWLASVRPASGDLEVDTALRTRSARVAVGLGVA